MTETITPEQAKKFVADGEFKTQENGAVFWSGNSVIDTDSRTDFPINGKIAERFCREQNEKLGTKKYQTIKGLPKSEFFDKAVFSSQEPWVRRKKLATIFA